MVLRCCLIGNISSEKYKVIALKKQESLTKPSVNKTAMQGFCHQSVSVIVFKAE